MIHSYCVLSLYWIPALGARNNNGPEKSQPPAMFQGESSSTPSDQRSVWRGMSMQTAKGEGGRAQEAEAGGSLPSKWRCWRRLPCETSIKTPGRVGQGSTPITLALQRLRQEGHMFENSLGYIVGQCLRNNPKEMWVTAMWICELRGFLGTEPVGGERAKPLRGDCAPFKRRQKDGAGKEAQDGPGLRVGVEARMGWGWDTQKALPSHSLGSSHWRDLSQWVASAAALCSKALGPA